MVVGIIIEAIYTWKVNSWWVVGGYCTILRTETVRFIKEHQFKTQNVGRKTIVALLHIPALQRTSLLLSLSLSSDRYPRARNTVYSLCGWSDISWSSALTGEILRLLGFMLTTRDGTTRRWRCSVASVKAGCGQQVQISERPQQWPTHLVARSTMRALYRTQALLTRHWGERRAARRVRALATPTSTYHWTGGDRIDPSLVEGGKWLRSESIGPLRDLRL